MSDIDAEREANHDNSPTTYDAGDFLGSAGSGHGSQADPMTDSKYMDSINAWVMTSIKLAKVAQDHPGEEDAPQEAIPLMKETVARFEPYSTDVIGQLLIDLFGVLSRRGLEYVYAALRSMDESYNAMATRNNANDDIIDRLKEALSDNPNIRIIRLRG
jgi:hypothetical protein